MEVETPLWGTLPYEMTKNIIGYLDVPALFSLSSTCRQILIMLDQSARLWQVRERCRVHLMVLNYAQSHINRSCLQVASECKISHQ